MPFRFRVLAFARTAAALSLLAACSPPTSFVDSGDELADVHDAARVDVPQDIPGTQCVADPECSDGLFCNGDERCLGGLCQPGVNPCDDHATCTTDSCAEDTRCAHEAVDSMCGDSNACNGVERCLPGTTGVMAGTGCQPVHPDNLIDCDDGNNCTIDTCDGSFGCVHSPRDLDGDGYVDRSCDYPGGRLGDDCNDSDPTVFPGAVEICDDGHDNNCNGLIDYLDTSAGCHALNDTCGGARALPGPGRYFGTTSGLHDYFMLSCNTAAARDNVFTFTLTEPHDVTVSMASTDVGAAIAVSDTCAPGPVADRACSRYVRPQAPTMFMRALPAGTYYLFTETPSTTPFAFTLTYAAATTPPPGDSCPPASPSVDLVSGTPRTLDLSALTDDLTVACNAGVPVADGVFHIHLDAIRNVDLTVTGAGTKYVSMRAGPCPGGAQLRCLSGAATVASSFRDLPIGDYYVVVESSTPGPVTASVNITDPGMRVVGDSCTSAAVLALGATLPATGSATVDYSTLLLGADYGTSCGSMAAPDGWRDAVYSFVLPASADTTVTVTPTAGWSPTYRWAVEATCGSQASTLGRCQSASGTSASSARYFGLPAGATFVVVETNTLPPAGAGFMVSVNATDPAARPTFEACPGAAIALTASGTNLTGTLTVDGSSPALDRSAQHGTICGSGGAPTGWTDMVFSFTIPDRRTVTVEFASSSPPYFWYLETETTCGSQSSGVPATVTGGSTTPAACVSAAGGGVPTGASSTVNLGALNAGTYYLIAENTWPTQGAVRVGVTAVP